MIIHHNIYHYKDLRNMQHVHFTFSLSFPKMSFIYYFFTRIGVKCNSPKFSIKTLEPLTGFPKAVTFHLKIPGIPDVLLFEL